MTLRQILLLIISALLLFFGYRYYKNDFCPTCCAQANDDRMGVSESLAVTGPLAFGWNNAEPIFTDDFSALKAEILSKKGDGDALEITGNYFAEETNDTKFEDLGYARAAAIGELLNKEDSSLNVITKSEMVRMIPGAKSADFESLSYKWISNEDSNKESISITSTGEAKILFPFNESNRIKSPEVENYLNNVAERLKANPDLKAYIVGYTDSLGEPGANRRLSERRAKKIRDMLRASGVQRSQIKTSGRGEADAIAPNTSEASRQLNRRAVITIK